MSILSELIARLSTIPDKEKRATQISEMIAVRGKLAISADVAEGLRGLSTALGAIEGLDFVEKAKQGLTVASSAANRLKIRMDGGAGFERKRVDEALTTINERLEIASSAVAKGWKALIDEQQRRFKPLADAAERASLPGADSLKASLVRLESWRDLPPGTIQQTADYLADTAGIPAAVANLGLEGKAGKFMIDASNGRAKARDLHDPEVVAFLDNYPAVWTILKVGM
ncbi:hypothetical protein [Rhizobium sp. CRRU65]|uniref:hypothetical protein n=1 Tax=Rhizobium sp. CRRU65 TaxID=3399566 RepID=UPI003AF85316